MSPSRPDALPDASRSHHLVAEETAFGYAIAAS
jgi:hypothetical protein